MMTSKLAELQVRWNALNDLATQLSSDDRRLSTGLDPQDPVARRARHCGVGLVWPLTIGTLLAAVLAEIDGVEMAIEGVRRDEHPGEDLPDPLGQWQPGNQAGAGQRSNLR